jgi:glutamate-1-semialdehyde 2,1-aminomutase
LDAGYATRKAAMNEFGAAFTAEGIVTRAGSRLYTFMADSDGVIGDALERLERVLGNVEKK